MCEESHESENELLDLQRVGRRDRPWRGDFPNG